MIKKLGMQITLATGLTLISGCAATPGVDYLFDDKTAASTMNFADLLEQIKNSRDDAIRRASIETRHTELAGLSLIATGLTAAGGIFYGAHIDFLAGAGLGATGIGALNQMYNPKSSRLAHIDAATKLSCLVQVSAPLKALANFTIDSSKSVEDNSKLLASATTTSTGVAAFTSSQSSKLDSIYQNSSLISSAVANYKIRASLLSDAFSAVVLDLESKLELELPNITDLVSAAVAARTDFEAKLRAQEELEQEVNALNGSVAETTLQSLLDVGSYKEQLESCKTTGKRLADS